MMDGIDILFIVEWLLLESLHVCFQVLEDEIV